MIALCHPRHRNTSAPALSLINAIRAEAGATRR